MVWFYCWYTGCLFLGLIVRCCLVFCYLFIDTVVVVLLMFGIVIVLFGFVFFLFVFIVVVGCV